MKPTFRIHIIYSADGMRRPLSSRQDIPAESAKEAVAMAVSFISSAYLSGYETLSWTAENLDLRDNPTTGETVSERAAAVTLEALAKSKKMRQELGL